MLETGLHRDSMTREKGQLGGASRQAFERGEAVLRGKLADCVHAGVKREGRKARTGVANFGETQTDLRPDVR
jgi:hypothetical protein